LALIRIKRTTVPGLVPTGLTYGEPAVNLSDQVLYVGGTNDNAVLIAGGGSETRWSDARPTTATDIDGIPAGTTFDLGATAISILERILYPYIPVTFSAFDSKLNTTYELGQTATTVSQTVTWSVTGGPTSNWVPGSGNISYSGFAIGSLATGFDLPDDDATPLTNNISVTYPALRGTSLSDNTITVSITGQQIERTPIVSRNDTSRWWSKMYWGKSTNTDLTNPFSLTLGSSATITTTGSGSRSATAAAGAGYYYLFLHNYYELTSMINQVGGAGFVVGLRENIGGSITSHSVMNAQGFTADYKIYRSLNELNGDLNITVEYDRDT
jgi:hypothetical protein